MKATENKNVSTLNFGAIVTIQLTRSKSKRGILKGRNSVKKS